MRRRDLLATAGLASLAGCTASLPTLCSRPAFRTDRLEFETRRYSSVGRWWSYPGTILATEPAHTERFDPPEEFTAQRDVELESAERAFIDDTDFDESVLVGLVVGTSSQSTAARVTHVVREDHRVHCYVCIRRRGRTDDLAPQGRLIRTAESWNPDEVRVTVTDGNDATETFDSDGTGRDILER
ncbi:hypothetical protein GS429_08120 [Natronorubrum sp. JWXQ-INN-674]|uniref:Lipoprotein n=1 Tax=Natronorubrum halalkaliphilum TaxID=2691917 RepID=A0A6B0VLL2_9EURY|nr:hypothetical protein [Natronorubrum halalkaliphilum]MXV62025.1 hypothetical protein [Natronorubrum halalkaliphilum]